MPLHLHAPDTTLQQNPTAQAQDEPTKIKNTEFSYSNLEVHQLIAKIVSGYSQSSECRQWTKTDGKWQRAGADAAVVGLERDPLYLRACVQ